MKHLNKMLMVCLTFVSTITYSMENHQEELNKKEQLRIAMRDLWNDHGVWTHEYIVATLADMPNAPLAAKRLLKNQEDIGNAIIPFYGQKAGEQLTKLLKEHILIAVDLVAAAKNKNQMKLKQADEKWHKNAQDIAAFLSKANKFWPKDALVQMLNEHLSLTSKQAVARLENKWEDDIDLYDKIRTQLNSMADDLTAGIIKQFPDKFEEN